MLAGLLRRSAVAEQGSTFRKAVIAGQEIPEGPLIQPVLSELGATMASLGQAV
ncbi:hypothetical protein I545_6557 [Mycobacterium kansasii 662]|uniref:Uncharacterized protein n=1 Tax=Mycobacterium kansasii 662 TaxID=1299326 RepID=X7YGN1_MYCKA|nr:hypothetical protein I545_6557 [Mycobacterium kansasii 662]